MRRGSLGGGGWGEWGGEDGAEAKSQGLPATSSAERLQPRPLSTFKDFFWHVDKMDGVQPFPE